MQGIGVPVKNSEGLKKPLPKRQLSPTCRRYTFCVFSVLPSSALCLPLEQATQLRCRRGCGRRMFLPSTAGKLLVRTLVHPCLTPAKLRNDKSTTYFVNLTSCAWLTVNDTNQPVWWHWIELTIPDTITDARHAGIYVDGDGNGDKVPAKDLIGAVFAETLGSTHAILQGVYQSSPPSSVRAFASNPESTLVL